MQIYRISLIVSCKFYMKIHMRNTVRLTIEMRLTFKVSVESTCSCVRSIYEETCPVISSSRQGKLVHRSVDGQNLGMRLIESSTTYKRGSTVCTCCYVPIHLYIEQQSRVMADGMRKNALSLCKQPASPVRLQNCAGMHAIMVT